MSFITLGKSSSEKGIVVWAIALIETMVDAEVLAEEG